MYAEEWTLQTSTETLTSLFLQKLLFHSSPLTTFFFCQIYTCFFPFLFSSKQEAVPSVRNFSGIDVCSFKEEREIYPPFKKSRQTFSSNGKCCPENIFPLMPRNQTEDTNTEKP